MTARRAQGRRRLRGPLRPPRRRRLLARLPDRRRPRGGRGRHPGGVPLDLAQRRPLRPARGSVRVLDARASSATARSTPCGAPAGPAPKLDLDDEARARAPARRASCTDAEAIRRETAREVRGALEELPDEQSQGDRARLLRRLQPLRDRRDAGRCRWARSRAGCGSGWRRSGPRSPSGWASRAVGGAAVSATHATTSAARRPRRLRARRARAPTRRRASSATSTAASAAASGCAGCSPAVDLLPASVEQLDAAAEPAREPDGDGARRGARPRRAPSRRERAERWSARAARSSCCARRPAWRPSSCSSPASASATSLRGDDEPRARRSSGPSRSAIGAECRRRSSVSGDAATLHVDEPAATRRRRGLPGLGPARRRDGAAQHLRRSTRGRDRRGRDPGILDGADAVLVTARARGGGSRQPTAPTAAARAPRLASRPSARFVAADGDLLPASRPGDGRLLLELRRGRSAPTA